MLRPRRWGPRSLPRHGTQPSRSPIVIAAESQADVYPLKFSWIGSTDTAMKDAKFVADAKKTGISVNPLTGSEIETLLKRVYATDRAVVEMLKKAIPKMG